MEIKVNGESQRIEDEALTISRLLTIRKVESPEMVAVQLNGAFVAKETYETTTVAAGDEVDFLFFMGGGRE